MKNQLVCLCTCILCLITIPVLAQVDNLSKTNYGIWQSYGDPVSATINPEIRGRLCNFRWADIEPSPDKWNWKEFDNSLASRATDGLPIIFMVYTEEDAPEWLYSNGVPKVAQKDPKGNLISYAPFYTDPEYKIYFKRMITKVHQHVESLPAYIRKQVIAVQGCFGSTGDYINYKGDVDPLYRITPGGFYALFQEFSQYYYDEYKNTNPQIKLLSNPKNNGPDQAMWIFQNCPGGWIKTGTLGKGYQLNDETVKATWLYPMINKPILNGEYVRARSEITGGTTDAGWWNRAPAKNMFALMCYGIYWGLDWSNQGYEHISDKMYDSAYGFYNKYAGEKDPARSAFAMCALRDGLDAHDATRFPEAVYGKVDRANKVRFINIANAFGANGAMLEDVTSAMADEMDNLAARGINDVGWNIFPGNYERFLHQISPDNTSVGYWNIESANKNDMYGKYGRGFDLANGKDALYFDVDDAFLNNTPLNGEKPVIIEITYLDNSDGSWQLFYDGVSDNYKPSVEIKGTNSKLWKKASVTIYDAHFANRGEKWSDFYIKNTGSKNVIFSVVELRRPYEGEIMGLNASKLAAFTTVCTNGTSYQTLTVSGGFMQGGDVVVGPLKGFGFSIDNGKTYPDSVIIKNVGASFSQKIFVKFQPAAAAVYNGDIPVRGYNVPSISIPSEATAVNSSPTLQLTPKALSCNGAKDGAIDLVASGGNGPFTYSWAGPDYFWVTTEDINKIAAGTYTVTVKSLGGCTTKTSVQVTEPTALQATVSAQPIQTGQTTTDVIVTATGGTAPYTGTGNFTAGPGTYNYNVTDASGCSSGSSITIAPPSNALTAFTSRNEILCHGGYTTVTISAAGGTAPYTGTGDFVVPAGTYTYTITDATGTVSSVSVTVSEPSVVSASVNAENILCSGGTANINVTATGGVAPYTGTGNFTVGAGAHTYTVKDANGCPSVKTINLTEPGKLNTSVTAGSILCSGGTADISVTATGGVAPYTGTGNFTVNAGTYDYEVTDANGCKVVNTIGVTEPSPLNISAIAEPFAGNATTTTVNVTATGGIAPYMGTGNFNVNEGTYNYSITDANGCQVGTSVNVINGAILKATATTGTILCNGGTTTVNVSATGGVAPYTGTGTFTVSAGTYTYSVTDATGQASSTTVTIAEPGFLQINSITKADVASCDVESGSIIINTTGGTSPYQYNLNAGPYQSSNSFTNLKDGNYTIIVKDANGCITSTPAVITKSAPMKAWFSEVSDVSICGLADGIVTVASEGGLAPFQFSIDHEPFQSGNVFSRLPQGEHVVVVMDSRGCETSAFTTIRKDSPLDLIVQNNSPVTGCGDNDGSITVAASGGAGKYQFCLNGQPYKGENIFAELSDGDYTITVKDWRGCTRSISVSVAKTPTLVARVQDITNADACINNAALTVAHEGGTAPYQYSINGGAFQENNVFNNLSAGMYTVKVKDGSGCIASTIAVIAKAPGMILSADKTDISCKGGSDGTITVTSNGGNGTLEYSIDNKPFDFRNIFGNLKAGIHSITVKDSKNCTAVINVTIADGVENCGTSLPGAAPEPHSNGFEVEVLPNPSPTEFTLITSSDHTERVQIFITDMAGRIVYRTDGAPNQQYRFGSQFAPGMYMVRVVQGQQMKTVKVIKTK